MTLIRMLLGIALAVLLLPVALVLLPVVAVWTHFVFRRAAREVDALDERAAPEAEYPPVFARLAALGIAESPLASARGRTMRRARPDGAGCVTRRPGSSSGSPSTRLIRSRRSHGWRRCGAVMRTRRIVAPARVPRSVATSRTSRRSVSGRVRSSRTTPFPFRTSCARSGRGPATGRVRLDSRNPLGYNLE